MSVHVFLGPSLPVDSARTILRAEYHPPVRVGDVCDLLVNQEPPRIIAIVDGLFEQTPTVWHKEILYALHRGVRVFGAASMGALRAAELHPFGMEGVGEIFGWFRSGELEDDDEVAVVHAPPDEGSRPLSEAMVNLRDGIRSAAAAGLLSPATARELVAGAKALYYPDRSWTAVYEIGRQRNLPTGEITALSDFVQRHAPDVKRRDAVALLSHLADLTAETVPQIVATFQFEPTYNWEKLVAIVRGSRRAGELSNRLGMPISQAYAAVKSTRPDLLSAALLDVLSTQEAQRLGLIDLQDGRDPNEGTTLDVLARRYANDLHEYLLAHLEQAELIDTVREWRRGDSSALGG